jgi:hypothetical protein
MLARLQAGQHVSMFGAGMPGALHARHVIEKFNDGQIDAVLQFAMKHIQVSFAKFLFYFFSCILFLCAFLYPLQEVAFGMRHFVLSDGSEHDLPDPLRVVCRHRLAKMFIQECIQKGEKPPSLSTLYTLFDVVSRHDLKALAGLDNIAVAGEEAFDSLSSLTDRLAAEAPAAEAFATEQIKADLKRCITYLKTDCKSHLASSFSVASHCIMHALSDPSEPCFSSPPCDHEHPQHCVECERLEKTFAVLQGQIQSFISRHSDQEGADLQSEFNDLVKDIRDYRSHLVRAVHQSQQSSRLKNLQSQQCFVVVDWGQKYLPRKHREPQSLWFGKSGMSWLVTTIIFPIDHLDSCRTCVTLCAPLACESESASESTSASSSHTSSSVSASTSTSSSSALSASHNSASSFSIEEEQDLNTKYMTFYDSIAQSCKQDARADFWVLMNVLHDVHSKHPHLTEVLMQSDNGSGFHSSFFLAACFLYSKRLSGMQIVDYNFTESQCGKDWCDRHVAHCKNVVRRLVFFLYLSVISQFSLCKLCLFALFSAVNSGMDTETVFQLYNALSGGVPATNVAIFELSLDQSVMEDEEKSASSWPGISKLFHFVWNQNGVCAIVHLSASLIKVVFSLVPRCYRTQAIHDW